MNNSLHPIQLSERIETIDLVRGFALCGILLANLISFSGFYSLSLQQISDLPWYDRTTLFVIDWLIESKFYALFSILFGFGFWLQLNKQAPYLTVDLLIRTWYRRMLVLLIFGLTHMLFVWHGDILTLYSLLGLILPLFLRKTAKQLLIWIVVLAFAPILVHLILILTQEARFWSSLSTARDVFQYELNLANLSQLDMRTSKELSQVFFANILSAIDRPMSYLKTGRYFIVLAYFLLGLYLAKRYLGVQNSDNEFLRPNTRTILWLFIPGLILSGIYAWIKAVEGSPFLLNQLGIVQNFAQLLGAILLALAYIALLFKLYQNNQFGFIARQLINLGRMSFTNYLTQTSLCVMIFYGYGFSLMGKISFYQITLFAAAILSLQMLFCHYWLNNFKQGPLEIIWRKLTYPA